MSRFFILLLFLCYAIFRLVSAVSYRQISVVFTKILNLHSRRAASVFEKASNNLFHTQQKEVRYAVGKLLLFFLEQLIINCGLKIIHVHVCCTVGLGWLIWPLLWNLVKSSTRPNREKHFIESEWVNWDLLFYRRRFCECAWKLIFFFFFHFIPIRPSAHFLTICDDLTKWWWLEPLSTPYAEHVLENTLKMWNLHM